MDWVAWIIGAALAAVVAPVVAVVASRRGWVDDEMALSFGIAVGAVPTLLLWYLIAGLLR